jgi:acyl-CoA reductase-like NAD-dependent aldehyde dehydrogenase
MSTSQNRRPSGRRGCQKQSGWGREMGHEVLNNYTEVKAVAVQL